MLGSELQARVDAANNQRRQDIGILHNRLFDELFLGGSLPLERMNRSCSQRRTLQCTAAIDAG